MEKHEKIERGAAATELLNSPVFLSAVRSMRSRLVDELSNPVNAAADQKNLANVHQLMALRGLEDELASYEHDGRIAAGLDA